MGQASPGGPHRSACDEESHGKRLPVVEINSQVQQSQQVRKNQEPL